jgi:hypothetical protein
MAFENTLVKSRAGECRRLDVLRLVPCRRGLLESPCPIFRSPAAVSDSPDCDYGLLLRIDDRKRKSQSWNFLLLFLPTGHRSGAYGSCRQALWSSSTKSKAALGLRF